MHSLSDDADDSAQDRDGPGGNQDVPLLQDSVRDLLKSVPETWAEYDADALTASQSKALFLLVAAGMIERRVRFRTRILNHPVAVEGMLTATGEYGVVEALRDVLPIMWSDWRDALHEWRTGETRRGPTFFTERLKPDEWRLTDQGVLARRDLEEGHASSVFDFVLRRGFFDGRPRIVDGRIAAREPVRGQGQLVSVRKVHADSVSQNTVNVGNWQEGAEAFAAAFRTHVETDGGARQASGFTVASLRQMTGLENTALNKYAKKAGVKTPGRGQKNHKYSSADVRAILEVILENATEKKVLTKCREALRDLTKITE